MKKNYVGISNDLYGGMTPTGNLIRDAWVFGLLSESETCKGWNTAQIQQLHDQVFRAWEPYGHLPSRLPDRLREKHEKIYRKAIEQARASGWEPAGLDAKSGVSTKMPTPGLPLFSFDNSASLVQQVRRYQVTFGWYFSDDLLLKCESVYDDYYVTRGAASKKISGLIVALNARF